MERETPVFSALADPVRRSLLMSLAESPHTASQFARQYPMSRQGVMKHLSILYQAGLVSTRKEGRDVLYELKPEPLSDVEAFVKRLEAKWDERLMRLKKFVEDQD